MRRETLTVNPAQRMTEAELMRCVTDAASLLGYHWVHFRPAETRHGWRTPVSGPLGQGWPDLFLVRPRDQRALFVECKSEAGRVTPEQATVHDVLRMAGLDVRVVRPNGLDGLIEVMR